jgi:hypothetical protein
MATGDLCTTSLVKHTTQLCANGEALKCHIGAEVADHKQTGIMITSDRFVYLGGFTSVARLLLIYRSFWNGPSIAR